MSKIFCHICYSETSEELICDKCEKYYCEECSYTFTIHYQYEGSQCYYCSDQRRKNPVNMIQLRRENLVKILFDGTDLSQM